MAQNNGIIVETPTGEKGRVYAKNKPVKGYVDVHTLNKNNQLTSKKESHLRTTLKVIGYF